MPLFPFGAIFQSMASSKSPYSSAVMMSPPSPVRASSPLTTCQPAGAVF
jgi:hypothetical protein